MCAECRNDAHRASATTPQPSCASPVENDRGAIRFANNTVAEWFGYRPEQLQGKSIGMQPIGVIDGSRCIQKSHVVPVEDNERTDGDGAVLEARGL